MATHDEFERKLFHQVAGKGPVADKDGVELALVALEEAQRIRRIPRASRRELISRVRDGFEKGDMKEQSQESRRLTRLRRSLRR